MKMTEVVAALIRQGETFMICQRPADEDILAKIIERYGNTV